MAAVAANVIPFPLARDDGDDHQIAVIQLLDDLRFYQQVLDAIGAQAEILDDLVTAFEPRLGPILSRALRDVATSTSNAANRGQEHIAASRQRAWRALETGERFEQHHQDMVAAVRRLKACSGVGSECQL